MDNVENILSNLGSDVQIACSGIGGIGRSEKEETNQQLLIHIIPKIGEIK